MRGEAVRTEGRALGPLTEQEILGIVEEVLESHGEDPDDIDIEYVEDPDTAQPETGDLVIYPDTASLGLRQDVNKVGATLWDEEDLVREVGKSGLVMLGADYDLSLGGGDSDTYAATPIKVDSVEAKDLAGPYVNDASVALLQMVPHRVYDYTCRCVVKDDQVKERFDQSDRIALDLVDGELTDLPFDRTVQLTRDEMGELLQPGLDEDEARKKVRTLLREQLSRDIDLSREVNETQIYETRTVTPPDDELRIEGGTLVYRGIWTVKGGRKDVIIDSTTGEVLSPQLGDAELV